MVRPVMTMVMRFSSWLPVATPDCSLVPANCPTMIRSAAPYMACRNRASSTGTAKESREGRMGPAVREWEALFCITVLLGQTEVGRARKKEPDKKTGLPPAILSSS